MLYAEPDRMEKSQIGSFPGDVLKPRLDYFGVGYQNYDQIVRFGPAITVKTGSGQAAVEDTVSSTGYRPTGNYKEFELFGRSDLPRTVAVKGDHVVFSRGENSDKNVTTVIDANGEAVDQYHENDNLFDTLTEAVGSHQFTWLGRGTIADQALTAGFSVSSNGDTVYYILTQVYPNDRIPSEDKLRDQLNEDPRAVDSAEVNVDIDGRLVSVTMEMSGEQYRAVHGVETTGPSHPQITWGIDHDEGNEKMTLRHEAGEEVKADSLEVRLGGKQAGSMADEQFSTEYDTIGPDDELQIDESGHPTDDPLIVWHSTGSGGAALLMYDRGD